jgi:hypothetical protein
MNWINDVLQQEATRARVSLSLLLHAGNRAILKVLPDRSVDALDCYIVQALERLAVANLGCGFDALQAAVKLEVLRELSYEDIRQAAELSPEFARLEQERLALLRVPS